MRADYKLRNNPNARFTFPPPFGSRIRNPRLFEEGELGKKAESASDSSAMAGEKPSSTVGGHAPISSTATYLSASIAFSGEQEHRMVDAVEAAKREERKRLLDIDLGIAAPIFTFGGGTTEGHMREGNGQDTDCTLIYEWGEDIPFRFHGVTVREVGRYHNRHINGDIDHGEGNYSGCGGGCRADNNDKGRRS